MRRQLIVVDSLNSCREVEPRSEILDVGREVADGLALRHRSVSRLHARISRDGDTLFLEDRGSTFGTAVNDRSLKPGERVPLGDGDVLRFGHVRVICRFDDSALDEREIASLSNDAAAAAQTNARLVLLEGEAARRVPIAGARMTIGSGAHCEIRLEDCAAPIEVARLVFEASEFKISSRARGAPVRLGLSQEPVTDPITLDSNSVIFLHNSQGLFLHDFDAYGQPIEDRLASFPRSTFLAFVADQCGASRNSIASLCRDRAVIGQSLGELLVERGIVTPLFWRVVADRALSSLPRGRNWIRFWSSDL